MQPNSRRATYRTAPTAAVILALLGLCLMATGTVSAQDAQPGATLKVGDAAPALANGKWLKGEPVKAFETGKVYVMEFWATWCGPCIAAIPHVTELQHKYGKDGLVVIGQNVWENDGSASEPFVQKMGDKMDYRVVMDTAIGQDGQMAKTWMQAAGRNGIPCSFVIDRQGKIAWIGHPMAMEPVLKEVLAGTFDAKKFADKEAAQQAMGKKLTEAMRSGNTAEAMKLIDEMEQQNPEMTGRLEYARFNLQLKGKDYDGAYKTATKAMDALKDEPQVLNAIAWTIADAPGLEKRDLDIALKAAQRADELTKHEEPQILDTLARIHFDKGDVKKAVEIQTLAAQKADGQIKVKLEETLDKYKKAQTAQKTG